MGRANCLIGEDENLTLNFLQVCTKTELSLLSEIFEEVAYNLRAIWGGGEAGRKGKIKKQILEMISWD